MPERLDLMVVMPVYNEQASVRKSVIEWYEEVENWTPDFVLLVINDGSTDATREVLARLKERLGAQLEIVDQENQGHGQTCLTGYRMAVARGASYVFQIDSDGQCDPQYFFRLWRDRERCDVIYGARVRRDDGWRRVLASFILKLVVWVTCRAWCTDANVPYRLMRTSLLPPFLDRIPKSFSLANVALAMLLRRAPGVKQGTVPIRFRERYGGEPTVPIGRFGAKALEVIRDLRALLVR